MHSIKVTPAADRELDRLARRIPRRDFDRLRFAIRGLAGNPRPQDAIKLQGAANTYRIRVGSYRVVYKVHDDQELVIILKVVRRSETTYRA